MKNKSTNMRFTLYAKLIIACAMLFPSLAKAQSNTDYQSAATGLFSVAATWQEYSVGVGWSAATAPPSSHNLVTILSGNTVSAAGTSSTNSLNVQAGASLISDGLTQRSVRVYSLSLTNNGTIGGAAPLDSMNLEAEGNGLTCTISGSGSIRVNRFRAYYGLIGTVVDFNTNATFTNISTTGGSAVGLTAYYNSSNSTTAENITINQNAGNTITFVNGAVLHYATDSFTYNTGTYTYNINGTVDGSQSVGTTYLIPSNTNALSTTTLNVSGVYKFGAGLSAQNVAVNTTRGTIALNILPGGIVDLSATSKLTMGTSTFVMADGTAAMVRSIGVVDSTYPISTTQGGYNAVTLNNSGTPDKFTVNLKNTFDITPASPTEFVQRQWTISEATSGGSNDSVRLSWLTADQGSTFSPTGTVVIYIYNGTTTTSTTAVVTGAGTLTNPYTAAIGGVTSFGKFYVANAGALTVKPVSAVAATSVNVFPNPVNDKEIHVQMNGQAAGNYHVAVTNAMGQVVYNGTVAHTGNTSTHIISLGNDVTPGTYQLQVSGENEHAAVSVIVK